MDVIAYVLLGLLGAFTHAMLHAKSAKELGSWESIQGYVIGLIAGYVYFILHTEHGLPDHAMAFVVGYAGKDFIQQIVNRMFYKGGRSEEVEAREG